VQGLGPRVVGFGVEGVEREDQNGCRA